MTNIEAYKKAFEDAFEIGEDQLEGLKYQDIPNWDSVGHMTLISNIEDAFDIAFETNDIIDLNSFEKGKEILEQNYDIKF